MSILLILSFFPFPMYKVTKSGCDGLGVFSGKSKVSGSSLMYAGSVSSP